MKGEERDIYARYTKECPALIDVAKKTVFLEERQPALDRFATGNPMLQGKWSQRELNPRGGAGVGPEHFFTERTTFLCVRMDDIYHLKQKSSCDHSIFARLKPIL